ncbi:uncharacterized protein LOC142492476 [Ascaphus truei]|uniref:uncharacterized protein LOC142492476 n=2 Tax=Ascaphus truei TaxID=8439 RepID=UPI003F59F77C
MAASSRPSSCTRSPGSRKIWQALRKPGSSETGEPEGQSDGTGQGYEAWLDRTRFILRQEGVVDYWWAPGEFTEEAHLEELRLRWYDISSGVVDPKGSDRLRDPVEPAEPLSWVRPVAPGGHVSPEMEQVSSPGSASSTLLEEHHGDEDDEYDEDDATEETEIQSCDHEEVPIETVVPPNRPSTSTYDAIVASEGKIVDAENRRHSDMMTVLERMIGLQEETVSQLAHLHRVFIEVPKQLQKINTSFEALVVQQTQANYWRMTNVPQFNTSQPGSVHAGQFSPHSSDIHSPGPNVTGQVADIAVQVPDDILPLPSVQIQQQTPTKEATKTKQDTHETDQPSLVQCLPTCSHVSLGTSPVREQSLPKSPVGESLPKSPVGESLPKSPVGESLPKSPVGESLPKSPVGESLPKSPVGESLPTSPVGESLATSPVGESLATSPVGEQSLATSPAREVPEATQSGSVVPKVGGKRKRKIQETTSRPVTRSQKEQKK